MLGVRLGEHHQLDVGGVAAQVAEGLHQVVDLVLGQRQPQLDVGGGQRLAPPLEDIDAAQRRRLVALEQLGGVAGIAEHRLGHAVVEGGLDAREGLLGEHALELHPVGDAALDATDLRQAAVVGDIGGLGGPGRLGADARHHQEQLPLAARLAQALVGAVVEQPRQHRRFVVGELAVMVDEVHVLRRERGDIAHGVVQGGQQLGMTEGGEGGRASQFEHILEPLDFIGIGAAASGEERT